MFKQEGNSLVYQFDSEIVKIQPWGTDSLRVRATKYPCFTNRNNALLEQNKLEKTIVTIDKNLATICNGKIKAMIDHRGRISFFNNHGKIILSEFLRENSQEIVEGIDESRINEFNSALHIHPREFDSHLGGDFKLTQRFESNANEKIFGMGQYQQDLLDLKGTTLELAQRNSQSTIPFYVSSREYGFLWNNPAIGEVNFSTNLTKWTSEYAKEIDYWVTTGDSPKEIEHNYSAVTGHVPMMPDYAMGFWQSKLRYQTQEEVINAAKEFKRRNLPISIIVIDYFHWTKSGEFKFDPIYWPDPKKMVEELKQLDIEPVVSIWPTIDQTSSHFAEMKEYGLLVQDEKGVAVSNTFLGNNAFADFTNPKTRDYIWHLVKENYFSYGIKNYWLDVAEPEYTRYTFDNYRYYQGSALQYGNEYPVNYTQTFFDGLKACKVDSPISLVRSAWAGSQKYGALVWSGDIDSSFEALRNQLTIGLSIGLAGIPWWTTDIGGFNGGVNTDPEFQELVTRWFQFATFCPVMRMHGDREPHSKPLSKEGGGRMPSGDDTEPWSYGKRSYDIMSKYLRLRYALKSYISNVMREAHQYGDPVIRTLFYEFPQDNVSWSVKDEYMFGSELLVCPILFAHQTKRSVYLPVGKDWINCSTGESFYGGQTIDVSVKLDVIPVFAAKNNLHELVKIIKNSLE